MAKLLKDHFDRDYLRRLAEEIRKHEPAFPKQKMLSFVFDAEWEHRELKQRMRHISNAMHEYLPSDYEAALNILKQAAPQFGGFEAMFFPDFVEVYGLEKWDLSLPALEHFTEFSSSEFAVRPFIQQDQKRMMRQMNRWATSKNHHVRRLASEGSRPRLPWAMALPEFKKDPGPTLPILEKLKADPSEYVRRSVANHLNDISKDHPDLVLDIAKQWIKGKAETQWIVKHACRTLLKQGSPEVLALFGYQAPEEIRLQGFKISPKRVAWGRDVQFQFELVSQAGELGPLRVEYAIEFVRQNGVSSRKVFKISEGQVSQSSRSYSRSYSFKPISTRKYYPGLHRIAIIVNGQEMVDGQFELQA
ncbi:DNA alkylation repair protein [uncultured Gimesia sp.]|uniref:DNA alkylation repair protein n=1 Tax=uncultured Gimesia sp. TaxID=1678688 RepID=UPI0030DA27DF|tara:strand:+ start:18946 stop:20028 length:1083 start_codon:yes stop_codon:yes gene_type:complete